MSQSNGKSRRRSRALRAIRTLLLIGIDQSHAQSPCIFGACPCGPTRTRNPPSKAYEQIQSKSPPVARYAGGSFHRRSVSDIYGRRIQVQDKPRTSASR
ncbi:hypothetical protein OG21DRAFT_961413 [Imleria badia]|nr:hypothetical protein OG21DRAFT_961413 [Imleria badia]